MVPAATNNVKKEKIEKLCFEELYDRHFAAVNRYLRYRVGNSWDADDLTTIVFIKAMEKFDQFQGSGSAASWLFRIAHNSMVDYFKLKKDLPCNQINNERALTENPEENIISSEEIKLLHELVLRLPEEYRDIVSLRYVGELRFQQIAEVVGKSEGAVRAAHHRALKTLRRMFAERTGV